MHSNLCRISYRLAPAFEPNTSGRDSRSNAETNVTADSLTYLDALELIRLESPDLVRFLLDNLGLVQRLYCHYFIFNTQSLA